MEPSPPGESDVTAWALAAKFGDRTAAAAFIRATQHQVYRLLAYLVDRQEAEDLTQETYLRAMRALPQFAGRSSARSWLLAIARRVAADHIRVVVRRPRRAALDDWQVAAEAAQNRRSGGFEDGVLLHELLRRLPQDRREAFVMTQVVGMSYTEAAEVCECPVGTIRSRVARAREDLVRAINGHGRTGRGVSASS
jgi:RNA polymerase sigma-70 factor (ECF subfamily)